MRIGFMLGLIVVLAVAVLYSAATPGEGERIYMDKCASCHANDGSGNTARGLTLKVPDLRSPELHKKTDEQLMELIVKTKGHTSYRKQLNDKQLLNLVLFMRRLRAGKMGTEENGV